MSVEFKTISEFSSYEVSLCGKIIRKIDTGKVLNQTLDKERISAHQHEAG